MPESYSKEETYSLKIGLYAALAIFVIGVFTFFSKKTSAELDDGHFYEITARFGRTDGLLVGDKVRLAGMTIGQVVDAKLDEHFNAIMTLNVRDDVLIPDDSSASIVSSGLMGNKYIEIEPGGSPDYIQPGGIISYTQDALVIEELIDRIISIGKANQKK